MSTLQGRKPTTMTIQFTVTEQKLVDILQDGEPHARKDLQLAIDGEYTAAVTVRQHISSIRKKLNPIGQTIVCTLLNRQIQYRWMRLLHSPYRD